MNKLEFDLENNTDKIICDFKIKTHHTIPVRRSHLELINKKKGTCHLVEFTIPANHYRVSKKKGKINEHLDLTRELNKKHEGDSDTNCSWGTWNGPRRLGKNLMKLEIWRKIKTIRKKGLLKPTRILRKVLDLREDLL